MKFGQTIKSRLREQACFAAWSCMKPCTTCSRLSLLLNRMQQRFCETLARGVQKSGAAATKQANYTGVPEVT